MNTKSERQKSGNEQQYMSEEERKKKQRWSQQKKGRKNIFESQGGGIESNCGRNSFRTYEINDVQYCIVKNGNSNATPVGSSRTHSVDVNITHFFSEQKDKNREFDDGSIQMEPLKRVEGKDSRPMAPRRTYSNDILSRSKTRSTTISTNQNADEYSNERRRKTNKKSRNSRINSIDDESNQKHDELGMGSFNSLRIDSDKSTRMSKRDKREYTSTASISIETSRTSAYVGRHSMRKSKMKNDDNYDADKHITQDCRRSRNSTLAAPIDVKMPSSKRKGDRVTQSERWMRTVESVDTEIGADSATISKHAEDSLNRACDGLSRSTQKDRIRRYMNEEGLDHRLFHDNHEAARHVTPDSNYAPRRPKLVHEIIDSAESLDVESFHAIDECGRSQGTMHSVEDFEDFDDGFYGMELQTPGMIDFDEKMLELMRRANPEVTDHLDRRVHRKREMVAYDQNMPLMTRQALLTRQASSQVARQYFDSKGIDKQRLLLRSDSLSSTHSRDELRLSSHRTIRSTHGRRGPPRTKSSGLGAMRQSSYLQSIGGTSRMSELNDSRRVSRSKSTYCGTISRMQPPSRTKSLQRRASGELIGSHTMREPPRTSANNALARRRMLQRASSTTSLRRSTSNGSARTPRMPERKASKSRYNRESDSSGNDSEFGSDCESFTSPRNTKVPRSLLHSKKKYPEAVNKNDMTNKRNRTKLHLLTYRTKMGVDMNSLLKQIRGERPRSPIKTLRMPSP